jgi:hypothetical protein
MGFARPIDFENALVMDAKTRAQKRDKAALIKQATEILIAARDEPQMVPVDDGPADPSNPDGPHNTHEIPAVNPIWKQYGFESIEGACAMLVRFEAVVI